MKLTMLGTGNATVTECYNTCFILEENENYFLVDGGGGNTLLRQLKKAGISWKSIREIFVTHQHIDHLLGIIWMMRMVCQGLSRKEFDGEVRIYGHGEVIALLRNLAETLLLPKEVGFLDNGLYFVEVEDGETRTIYDKEVTFFDIGSTKTKQFGFSMKLADGKKLVCCGDEPYNECERKYAEGSDWMFHEAFCLYAHADIFKPYQKHHSTAKDAGKLAQELGVKNLVLYHTEDKNIKERKKLYTEEAKTEFSGNVFVPEDLETIEIK